MSDIRGYTAIAEVAEPTRLAAQLNDHRQAMNDAILAHGGTVMQYVGDAVMAVFGAPGALHDHEARALAAAAQMHVSQDALNTDWISQRLPPFGLGIGLSTGQVAAAMLGSYGPGRVHRRRRHRQSGRSALRRGPPSRKYRRERGHYASE